MPNREASWVRPVMTTLGAGLSAAAVWYFRTQLLTAAMRAAPAAAARNLPRMAKGLVKRLPQGPRSARWLPRALRVPERSAPV